MSFELITKPSAGSHKPPMTCSVSKSMVLFSPDLHDEFKDKIHVEVYHDKKENKFGFKPCKEQTKDTYTFDFKRNNVGYPKKLLCLLPLGLYPVHKEGGILVIYKKEIIQTKEQKKYNEISEKVLEDHKKSQEKK